MPTTTEASPSLTPDRRFFGEYSEDTRQSLGRAALSDIYISLGHFYGGEPIVVRTTSEHAVLIRPSVDSETMAGSGDDYESALLEAWEGMRRLETVSTQSLAEIEMTNSGATVGFTKLEHYAPKMAPSNETYPIPAYLEGLIEHDDQEDFTWDKTIEEEGWQEELRSLAGDYITNDPDGKKLAESLGIRSLDHLTPEQAVKFSTAFVQNVSKYERDFRGYPAGNRADSMTTYELLSEGMNRKNHPLWRGNGVCRNIACNVKAVFEALKDTQGELSMLRNTYSVYSGGWNGAGYNDKRAEESYAPERRRGGHAWNKFVTVGEDGSAVVTVVDATWALENTIDSAVQHLDYAELRSTPLIIDLLKASESRAEALGGLNEYIRKLSSSKGVRSRLDIDRREQLWQYITTEYIKAMESVLKSPEGLPDGFVLPLEIGAGAMSMAGKLNPNEIETLFPLYESNGSLGRDGMRRLIHLYDRERGKTKSSTARRWSPEMMIFKNDDLQTLAFDAVGEDRVSQMANTSIQFRKRWNDLRRKGAV